MNNIGFFTCQLDSCKRITVYISALLVWEQTQANGVPYDLPPSEVLDHEMDYLELCYA